jgi:hypothetical protein
VLNEMCDKQAVGAGPCHLPAGHKGECDHKDEQRDMEDAHQQAGEWLDDFMHHDDNQA